MTTLTREDIPTGGVASCVYCGEIVQEFQDPYSYNLDYGIAGDFGCSDSPWTNDEGTGGHIPYTEMGRLYVLQDEMAKQGISAEEEE